MTVLRTFRPETQRDGSPGTVGAGQLTYLMIGALFSLSPVFVFYDTSAFIVETWYGSTAFNHCFLILPIVGYLVWNQRNALRSIALAPEWMGLPVVVAACLVWLVAHTTGTHVIQELALVVTIDAMVLTILGWNAVRLLWFPLVYLYLAVPFGAALIPPLQQITAEFAVYLLRAAGVPVFVDGNLISVPTGNWYVAEACAGLRYLIASLALGVLFAGITYKSWARRVLFLAISLVVPIVANGIRAFGIVYIAYKTNNEFAAGIDHLIYGWVFFTLVTLVVLGFGMAIRDKSSANDQQRHFVPAQAIQPLRTLVLSGIIAAMPVAAAKAYDSYIARATTSSLFDFAMPDRFGNFRATSDSRERMDLKFAGADVAKHIAYAYDDLRVYLHIGYYDSQRPGAEIVSSDHDLTSNWDVVATGFTAFEPEGGLRSTQYLWIGSGNQRRLIWYWYWVDGQFTTSPYLAKLLEAKVKLLGGTRPAAIIVLQTGDLETEASANAVLRRFVMQLGDLSSVLEVSASH